MGVSSGNSGRTFSEKSVRFDEEINSDRLVADQGNEGKDDTNADTTRDPGTAERRGICQDSFRKVLSGFYHAA